MNSYWWQLPGPAHFLAFVEDDLRQGKNVFLALPEYMPRDFLRIALANRVKDDFWYWRPIFLQEEPKFRDEPVRLLFNRFVGRREARIDVNALVERDSFHANLIWLEGLEEVSTSTWEAWKAFFKDYTHSCRKLAEGKRTLFCVPLVGTLATQILPGEALTLSIRRWCGVVEQLDMSLYISLLSKNTCFTNRLKKNLKIAISTELAGTDPELAELLFKLPFENLLEPFDNLFNQLKEIAKERGWHEEQVRDPQWHLGMSDEIEGTFFIHAAAVALQGDKGKNELQRRIWRGQVRILFPFLEEKRIALLKELQHLRLLKVPFETSVGLIENLHDLELSHIYHQTKNSHLPSKTRNLINILTDIRHTIAHLKPIEVKQWRELQRLLKK